MFCVELCINNDIYRDVEDAVPYEIFDILRKDAVPYEIFPRPWGEGRVRVKRVLNFVKNGLFRVLY